MPRLMPAEAPGGEGAGGGGPGQENQEVRDRGAGYRGVAVLEDLGEGADREQADGRRQPVRDGKRRVEDAGHDGQGKVAGVGDRGRGLGAARDRTEREAQGAEAGDAEHEPAEDLRQAARARDRAEGERADGHDGRGDRERGGGRAAKDAGQVGARGQRGGPDALQDAVVPEGGELRAEIHVSGDDHAERDDRWYEDHLTLDVRARQVPGGGGRPDEQQQGERQGEGEQRVLGAAPERALFEERLAVRQADGAAQLMPPNGYCGVRDCPSELLGFRELSGLSRARWRSLRSGHDPSGVLGCLWEILVCRTPDGDFCHQARDTSGGTGGRPPGRYAGARTTVTSWR